jgi:hypothetical protein
MEQTRGRSLADVRHLFYTARMPDRDPKLTPADPSDIAGSVAFALLNSGRKRVHDSDQLTAAIVAQRIVAHLERCGYAIFKQPPITGSAPLNPAASWPHTKPEDMK